MTAVTTILHRYTDAVLYQSELPLREAVVAAVKARAYLRGANLRGARLTGANLTWANLTWANLRRAYLTGADLAGANLAWANLTAANLTGADLAGANLTAANLTGADLAGSDLYGANLTWANLDGADLYGANLRRAYLTGADLAGANLAWADLRRADLRRADLTGANLDGANLRGWLMPDAPSVESLRDAVAAHIEAHHELHDQSEWGDGSPDPSCYTPCCVAGLACHLGGGDRGLSVQTAATLLLWHKDLPMPDFSGGTSREDILAALRAKAAT